MIGVNRSGERIEKGELLIWEELRKRGVVRVCGRF